MYAPSLQYKDARGFRPTLASDLALLKLTLAPKMQEANTSKIDDVRYPALSAVMSDARQFTDYRAHCALNISPASQFKAKKWIVDNAVNIIELSRKRQAEKLGTAAVQLSGPPAAAALTCSTDSCDLQLINGQGVGMERTNTWAQKDIPLFGTFSYAAGTAQMTAPLYTVKQEGGRNSIRG
jgi:hypothetical protein